MQRRRHHPVTGLLLSSLLVAAAAPAATAADDQPTGWLTLAELGFDPPPEAILAASVIAWDPTGNVLPWDPTGGVTSLETVEQDADETVVTLSSDILFDPSDATLSPAAEAKIAELVAAIPDGARVQVHGHTDTVDSDDANQDLSERRAQAVAGAITATRDDLELEVEGFGESDLVEPETGDEESVAGARAANRRVEIRYED